LPKFSSAHFASASERARKFMRKRILLNLVLLFIASYSFAQNGIVRGTVYDDATGEALIGVTVVVDGTDKGTITDIDGKFEIQLAPETYNLKISYVSYATLNIENTKVTADEVTVLDNIRMKEDVAQLAEVVVTAQAINTTEEALLTVKMKSTNLLDGISSTSFRKIGDSDAASAIKRVSGVSVEDGKYVFVRGLGDRYTKSTLNGVDIPGLDPDRNTVQMDMFPTSLIDNIIVLKSFTSDLPGDFTGGIVNIDIKDFPEEKTFNISLSGGFNPSMHFNSDYLTYDGGDTDFLGFDDGTREIPTDRSTTNIPLYPEVVGRPDSEAGLRFRSILESFNPTMAAMRKSSFMDYGMGLNFGNQITRGKSTIGYNLSLVYKNATEYYEGAEYGRYGKGNADEYELQTLEYQKGDYGTNNVVLSGLAGIALKRERAKYRINFLHSQNGESKAGVFDFRGSEFGAVFEADQNNLEYSERSLTNILLAGTHFNKDASLEIEWKLSPTRSRIEDPDIRFIRYRTDNGSPTINTEVGLPERIWRYLDEDNLAGKIDATKKYQLLGKPASLKSGGGYTYKTRDYEIQNFQFVPFRVVTTGDPNEIFFPENLWPSNENGTRGTRYEPGFLPFNTNKFDAQVENIALYASNEFALTTFLKAVLGLRVETYKQYYTGLNQEGLALDDEEVLDDLDFFPSVNLIYALTETQNLRFSYSRTVARPSFKEASYAQIFDPLTGRIFIGGFSEDVDQVTGEVFWDGNLTASKIDNLDLRWEIFQKRGQTFSLGGFYKTFDRPIEIVQYVIAPNNFQPRNVGDGKALGVEFEARQRLGFISKMLDNFTINGNVTFTYSEIEMGLTEYNARVRKARSGETIDRTRDMAGQAPYLINTGVSYNGVENGLEAGLFYYVQGRTLTYVGIAEKPDVYSVPFHSLNFNANKTFGPAKKFQLGVNISNLLGSKRKLVFESFKAKDQVFSRLDPGTNITLKLAYSFR
jgi:outer membrane receptor protein involved in Fe transport